MKGMLLRGACVCTGLLTLFIFNRAWCAKPPELREAEEVAATLVRNALEAEVAGDAQRRSDLLRRALDAA